MSVDSHCHLDFPELLDDIEGVLDRASQGGVTTLVTICTKLSAASSIRELASRYHNMYCSVGLHPNECTEEEQFLTPTLSQHLQQESTFDKVVGLGETGLDYYYENSRPDQQQYSFSAHIDAALKQDLPLIIHTRAAEEDTVNLLKSVGGHKARGVIHCFTGSMNLARECLELGFYISLSGIVTFKNAADLREVAKYVPLDRLLIETDAPYLAPIPHRGQRNEPAFVAHTLAFLADLKGISATSLDHLTTQNFFSLFTKAKPPILPGFQKCA